MELIVIKLAYAFTTTRWTSQSGGSAAAGLEIDSMESVYSQIVPLAIDEDGGAPHCSIE